MSRRRLDRLIVERGLATTRARAQRLIERGLVTCGGEIARKASMTVADDVEIALQEPLRYVSRGGDKLHGALAAFASSGLQVEGVVAVDVGASTGGFTDCLLQHGAARVIAVDVGRDLLDPGLRADDRVRVMDETNARHLTVDELGEDVDLVVCDASFISLSHLVGAFASWLSPGGAVVVLAKPQFEVDPSVARKAKGVIRDPAIRDEALERVREELKRGGFAIVNEVDSDVLGPQGNRERFLFARLLSDVATL